MTMRTQYPMTCSCGHKGAIKMSENDQPFSKCWESYSLEDLNGDSYYVEGFADWPQVFNNLRPTCPVCGSQLSSDNFDKSI
jgi:hypothetical protein